MNPIDNYLKNRIKENLLDAFVSGKNGLEFDINEKTKEIFNLIKDNVGENK